MAMTAQDWADFSDNQATAIANGFQNISALGYKKEIPTFSGDLDESLPIDEWFKVADQVAVTAGWNNQQKLKYYKDRLTKSAANYSNTLAANVLGDYDQWHTAMLNAFQDIALKNLRKDQLKHLKQRQAERTRDFRKRIDETYRNAYGVDIDNSQDQHVLILKNEIKKETLLNGLRSEILFIIWGRLPPAATYEQAADTAIECEQIIEVRRSTESRTLGQALDAEKKAKEAEQKAHTEAEKQAQKEDYDTMKELVKQMANLQLSSVNATGQVRTVAYVREDRERQGKGHVRFNDRTRGRSEEYGNRPYYRPTVRRPSNEWRQRTPSPGWTQQSREQSQERETRTCYFCKHKGHIKRECRKYKAFMENQPPPQQYRGPNPTSSFRRN
jgi:hypothetical protein